VKTLSSIQNPELKKLRLLYQKARERKKSHLFVIEGEREILKAIKGGYRFESLFIHEEALVISRNYLNLMLTTIFTVWKLIFLNDLVFVQDQKK